VSAPARTLPLVSEADDDGGRTVIVIGDGDLSDEVVTALESAGANVERLPQPKRDEIADALEGGPVESIAVVAREDAFVLRMALLVRSVNDEVPLLLTIFDQTMAEQVTAEMPNTRVTSLAEIVAPSLAGPCIDEDAAAVRVTDDEDEDPVLIAEDDGELSERPVPQLKAHRFEALARALFTPYDKSAGLLLYGAIGLVAILLIETLSAIIVLDNSVVDAFYGAAKTLVTVDPNLDVDEGPGWHKVFISLTMIVALVFAAAFTAGLVNRVVEKRLTGLVGRRAVPRRDHVVVAGLGQVGMRLCLLLRSCGVPVVVVEEDENARNIGRARELGLPLVIGRASDHSLMARLSLHKARAVAAVTGDDLENISAAMTARAIEKDIRVVMRVGDGDVANETRSLLALGLVRDVHRIAAVLIASMALGEDAESVVCIGDDAHLRFPDGRLEEVEVEAVAD
jgi:Trk K+ transport system NAD-binding subunit